MQVCFFCGAANSPDAKSCHSCSQLLAGGEEESAEGNEAIPTEMPTECPFCGQEVQEGDLVCGNCNSELVSTDPLDRPAPKSHERDITSRYNEFADKVQMVRDGRMSRSQFATWVLNLQQSMLAQRDRYVDFIKGSGYYEFGRDEVDMGMTGILEYEEAMEEMVMFGENPDADMAQLDAALEKMWRGNEKCNEAMRLNREFRAKLEEDWGYM